MTKILMLYSTKEAVFTKGEYFCNFELCTWPTTSRRSWSTFVTYLTSALNFVPSCGVNDDQLLVASNIDWIMISD